MAAGSPPPPPPTPPSPPHGPVCGVKLEIERYRRRLRAPRCYSDETADEAGPAGPGRYVIAVCTADSELAYFWASSASGCTFLFKFRLRVTVGQRHVSSFAWPRGTGPGRSSYESGRLVSSEPSSLSHWQSQAAAESAWHSQWVKVGRGHGLGHGHGHGHGHSHGHVHVHGHGPAATVGSRSQSWSWSRSRSCQRSCHFSAGRSLSGGARAASGPVTGPGRDLAAAEAEAPVLWLSEARAATLQHGGPGAREPELLHGPPGTGHTTGTASWFSGPAGGLGRIGPGYGPSRS
jgi:hypothetical protein